MSEDNWPTKRAQEMLDRIDFTMSDLRLIKSVYAQFQALDSTKKMAKLEDQIRHFQEREYKYLKTITERDLEIARLGLALGEALKLIPTPPVGHAAVDESKRTSTLFKS